MAASILVSGASIAGNAVAAVLARNGFDITVLERAPAFRDGGQNIDVRGVGRDVLRRMKLEDAALACGTGEEGTVWVNANGSEAARFVTDKIEGDGPTAEMEILRGDLAKLLYEAAPAQVRHRFGDHIVAVQDRPDGVDVSFASGTRETYDALIIAEGVGSTTRELVFPGENAPRWMDLTIAYFTIPRESGDDRMWRWYNAPDKRSVSLRPDRHGTTRAMLCVSRQTAGEEDWDSERQKAFLHDLFADAGWETPRILAHMDAAEDFYFDALRQVRLPRWSSGRVVLTGDAAWCLTPLGGIGATLAVTGAYVLAQEIMRHDTLPAAFEAYERQMRPMVEDGQAIPKIGPRLMHPRTRLGIAVLHGILGIASLEPLRDLAARAFGGPGEQVDLSRYD